MHSYSYAFRKAVARGRAPQRAWRLRRERGWLFTLDHYRDDVPPPMDVRKARFAEWVRRVLHQAEVQRGLSIPQIAAMANIGNPTIYRWRDGGGKHLPLAEQVLNFCDALDIDPTIPFGILWPGKNAESPAVADPIYLDDNYQILMRKLADPNVDEFEKEFIRETLHGLAVRPAGTGRKPQRSRRRSTAR